LTPAVGLTTHPQLMNPVLKKLVDKSTQELQNMSTAWIFSACESLCGSSDRAIAFPSNAQSPSVA
jgi:hypothetical protein